MKMIDELKPLYLYSANQKLYAPVDMTDKRRNSAILLLSPDMEVSVQMMRLPYLHNPNLFVSYYVDRNVVGYINNLDVEELDEEKEKAVSEAAFLDVINDIITIRDVKFTIDDNANYVDRACLYDVFKKKTASELIERLCIYKTPKAAKVIVHHSVQDLRQSAPREIERIYKKDNYGYYYKEEIHVLSKVAYDSETMWGDYYLYLKTELYNFIIRSYNRDIDYHVSKGIAIYYSGLLNWLENINKYNNCDINKNEKFIAKTVSTIVKDTNSDDLVIKFIKKNELSILKSYASDKLIADLKYIVFEEGLSSEERNKLSDDEFGIPSRRAYPLHDEEHVRHAIKMFNYCDHNEEKELADAIISKMEKFNINDVDVGENNRFSKYYTSTKNESAPVENDNISEKFFDVEKICSSLAPEELKRITFTNKYEDSKFVIKRIINYKEGEPAGFLDVYFFPSRPDVAQIVIAVDSNFRGIGVSRELVNELLASDLPSSYGFDMYYWTAHTDNYASQNLATSSGFEDTNKIDSYGRKVFIKRVNEVEDLAREARIHNSDTSIINENGSIFLLEADTNSQKIRQYLYRDRLRNSRDVLEIYNRIKALNPSIQKTYLELNMYKGLNLFVDLYYYNRLFLWNNTFILDKGVNMYFEFLTNLMNNGEVNKLYKRKTVFIPVDADSWTTSNGDITDYKVAINPISVINRLVRTNPEALRNAWGNKDVVFVGRRGYFKVNFHAFELKDLVRFNRNIEKLRSSSEPIVDDYEEDIATSSKKALAVQAIERLEKSKNITVNDISKVEKPKPVSNAPIHLRLSTVPMNLERQKDASKDIAIINIDSLDVGNMENLKKSPVYRNKLVDVYCVPNKK